MKLRAFIIIGIIFSVFSSCKMMPRDVESNEPGYGANQIIATSPDSLFFEKVLNNLKINGYSFESIDRANGYISIQPKTHSKYTNITMYPVFTYIKEGDKYKFIVSGTYSSYSQNHSESGAVIYMKMKSAASRLTWDEFMKQFSGVSNVTFSYRRL